MEEEQRNQVAEDNLPEEQVAEAPEEEVAVDGEQAEETEGEKAPQETKPVQEDAVDVEALKAELETAKAEAKRAKDTAANLKGKAVHLSKIVKRGLDEGLLSESELGVDGLDAKEVQVWVERGVDKDAVDAKLQYFDKQVTANPGWYGERYGDVNELIQNYAVVLRENPAERAALDATPDAVVVDYILRRGKEVADEIAELKTEGNALNVIRKLKKELATLKANPQPSESIAKPKTSVKNAPSVVVQTRPGGFYTDL